MRWYSLDTPCANSGAQSPACACVTGPQRASHRRCYSSIARSRLRPHSRCVACSGGCSDALPPANFQPTVRLVSACDAAPASETQIRPLTCLQHVFPRRAARHEHPQCRMTPVPVPRCLQLLARDNRRKGSFVHCHRQDRTAATTALSLALALQRLSQTRRPLPKQSAVRRSGTSKQAAAALPDQPWTPSRVPDV